MFCNADGLVIVGFVLWIIYQVHQNRLLKERAKEYSAFAQAWSIAKVAAIPIEAAPFGEYNVTMVVEEFGSTYFLFRDKKDWGRQAILVLGGIEGWNREYSNEQLLSIVEQNDTRQYSLANVGIVDIVPQCRSL